MTMWKFWQSRREALGNRPILDALVWNGTWAYAITLGKLLHPLCFLRLTRVVVNMTLDAVLLTCFVQIHSPIEY